MRTIRACAAVCLLTLLAACGLAAPSQTAADRPNIVFVLTDDLSMNLVPYMPHLLQLEQAGTSFDNSFVVDSFCCPSRSATFTGEYPHNDGVYLNQGPSGGFGAFMNNQDDQKSFAMTLQHAGYRTGFMGKYLNGYLPRFAPQPGWDEWDAAGNGYAEFNYWLNKNGRHKYFGDAPQDYLTDVLAHNAAHFIGSSARSGQPFMLEVATFAPHHPYTPAPRYVGADPTARLPRTPAFNAAPSNPPSWLAGRPKLTAAQIARLDGKFRLRVEADLAVDDLIGRLINRLAATGQLNNTYFVFSSDNGFHMADYRLVAGKQTAFDTDIRVPLVVRGPGVPAGRVDKHLVSNIDLAPTFEAVAGQPAPTSVDGRSLLGLWHGEHPSFWQRAVLIEHRRPGDDLGDPDRQGPAAGVPPSYEAIRTKRALVVQYGYGSGEVEYYRLRRDPYELHNLGAGAAPPRLLSALQSLQTCYGTINCQTAAQLPR